MNAPADNTSVAAVAATEGVDLRLSTEEFHADLERAGAHVKSKWGMAWFLAKRYPLGAVGLAVVVIFVLVAAFAPYITRHDPLATNPRISLGVPTAAHPMGTDFMGRDLYSRVVYGARTSLAVAFGATALGVFLGVLIGLACGFLGGTVDLTIQRFIDMLQSLPTLILAMAMAAALGPSLTNTIIAIAIPKLPSIARVIRANTLSLREMPFVEAARAMGMSEMRIAIRHILPNTLAPLIVLATAGLGSAILVEASLSFLGLGVPEPHPSWGRMLSESAAEYVRTAPWLVIFPGLAITFAVFGTNLLGDALRDLLDPRQRTTN
ncbi:MAG TPA: ABC transporter permease [Burkholderiales bacterium]|nr:ABC transporter permease [Burkholderiales bacterium]